MSGTASTTRRSCGDDYVSFIGRTSLLGDGEHVSCLRVKRNAFLGRPIMALIDLAVTAHANAMRIQTMIGNAALIIESELFAQQSMRAKWKSTHGGRYQTIQGLAVEDHLRVLRDRLMPLVEKFHRWAREHIEAIGRLRHKPAVRVERAEAINLVFVAR